MKHFLPTVICLFIFWSSPTAGLLGADKERNWSQSVLYLDVSRKLYNPLIPWTSESKQARKTAVVWDEETILTTAYWLRDATMIQAQKQGRGGWWDATIEWVDTDANLALLKVDEAEFWEGLKPMKLGGYPKPGSTGEILKWNDGILEENPTQIKKYDVHPGVLSQVQRVKLELSSDLEQPSTSDPVIQDGKLIGITTNRNGKRLLAMTSDFIRQAISSGTKGNQEQAGLPYFPFFWQSGENTSNLERLSAPPGKGIIISELTGGIPEAFPLQPKDVLLSVDGYKLETNGSYRSECCGPLSVENLAGGRPVKGREVRVEVLRDGNKLSFDLTLPVNRGEDQLTPLPPWNHSPEYFLVGGLVFQPLTQEYIDLLGNRYGNLRQFRLSYYGSEEKTSEREGVIFLSHVLADPYTLGYQDYRLLVLDSLNGKAVHTLHDLQAALEQAGRSFHELEFARGPGLQKMVLDAGKLEEATKRVMQSYRIPESKAVVPTTATASN